ncbi:MAG: M28 family peptidase [Desulfobacterales bacterium]|nr:M28 family peptidase [Desulfobacterales bacterium]
MPRSNPKVSLNGGAPMWAALRVFLALAGCFLSIAPWPAMAAPADDFQRDIIALSASGDRSVGSSGNRQAAAYIQEALEGSGFETVGRFRFRLPVRRHTAAALTFQDRDGQVTLQPLLANAVSPGTIQPGGLTGPLVYAGSGRLDEFNGREVAGAIVLMEMNSGRNWLNAANLGALALIYVDRGETPRALFEDKRELTPIQFTRLWAPIEAFEDIGVDPRRLDAQAPPQVTVNADTRWVDVTAENIFALIPGRDPDLAERVLIVEGFYDSHAYVAGRSPGADEACGIATLLALARQLRENPPARSILLLATDAHSEGLAGMREAVWNMHARSKYFVLKRKALGARLKRAKTILRTLKLENLTHAEVDPLLVEVVGEAIKSEVDRISRQLMRLRLEERNPETAAAIKNLAVQRRTLRTLGWKPTYGDIDTEERAWIERLIPGVLQTYKAVRKDLQQQLSHLKQAMAFRRVIRDKEIDAVISLHLSSHGDGVGAFNQGFHFKLRPHRASARVPAYSLMNDVLNAAADRVHTALGEGSLFQDSLRPSRRKPWYSYLPDEPAMGGEISALGGYIGLTLATTHDARPRWGTPADLPAHVDLDFARRQSAFVSALLQDLAAAPQYHEGQFPRIGLSVLNGTAKFIRHGELFARQPAPGSILLAFQGPARYHLRVDHTGHFEVKGISDKKNVYDKVILEGYRFDPETGDTRWAIDKKQTGKQRYRVKMQRRYMETDLMMFACRQTTLFNLLEPRSFRYMTKINLLDARLEAAPLKYWWSRIDTRDSTMASLFVEPETRFKMTLSDSVLRKKMILTGATARRPEGIGYLVNDWPRLYHTEYHVARDMWRLLKPRIDSLEEKGINDERLEGLQAEGLKALQTAETGLETRVYDVFQENAARSWALASRVYDQVESTQKDILFGVLFYIALFVPFAFCAERLIFGYRNIHKRIIAFTGLLLLLIAVIYNVHPAFDLAFSPTVVILAFFIIGLSLIVTLIIFLRFEEEMSLLQHRAQRKSVEGISRWKAFVASFFLGVSNLKRRRLRTALTCTTLIILTFTIMSFTSVKSTRLHARIFFNAHAPYQGYLLKNPDWRDLPPEALNALTNAFAGRTAAAPRVWIDTDDRTHATRIPVIRGAAQFEAQGLVGLSSREADFTGLDQALVAGRWFANDDEAAVVIPKRMAERLGIRSADLDQAAVTVWGSVYRVVGIFDSQLMTQRADLDGEPLTPVTFPSEVSAQMTEIEMEAMESGDDVRSFQSRYQHAPAELTFFMPYKTLMAAGGRLKAVALMPTDAEAAPRDTAHQLADRFGLVLFSGEPEGSFLYHSSDAIQYSGVPNIFIPLVISVFIVLNTMISSVYERKREIGIYTSVGLAPSHVSFLFIAEAIAFAVLSVVLGYLTAQTTAKLFAQTALWSGITVNYSSLAGVAAMLLVILVVLISVIYPSRVAAEIAIPDVNRSWAMPDPKQSRMSLPLPFLIKTDELQSLGGFLLSHFESHQDVSHGLFSTGRIGFDWQPPAEEMGASDTAGFELTSRVWLAPFDFGIMQQVAIAFRPAPEEAGFFEIHVDLTREAGEVNAWGRINKAFVNDLRKQLLIWRSMDAWTLNHYEVHLAERNQAASTPETQSPTEIGDDRKDRA